MLAITNPSVASLQLLPSAGRILELTRSECQQCKDVARLCSAVSVLCQLVVCDTPVGTCALQTLLTLTVNRYPKVYCLICAKVNVVA